MASHEEKRAYVTLITKSSYLTGVVILAYTLHKSKTPYPLIVLYTETLPKSSITVLEREAKRLNLIVQKTEALLPRDNENINLIAERFADTWTKLRVFELFSYDKVCYLDADMIIRRNMDAIFSVELPSPEWLAANHACVCNLDKDAWAPEEWNRENCAYTPTTHPSALTNPTVVKPDSRPTYHLLNSGMFLFCPSEALWQEMLHYFNTSSELGSFKFPDQDFLAAFFRNKWMSVGWQYNALKTMRYWHEAMWRDDSVACLHFIVDKPWAKRVGSDGVAGYLGRDGVTHTWWWEEFEQWELERGGSGGGEKDEEVLSIVRKHTAKPIGEEDDETEEMRAIGSQVQAFANNKPGQKEKMKNTE